MTDFMTKLLHCQQKNDSWLCVGLDPHPGYLPEDVDLLTFGRGIIEATSDVVCAYKFNLAFFLAYGPDGFRGLREIMEVVPDDIPIVLDAKFGDIGYTAERYGKVAFEVLPSDAVPVRP